jgi:methionine sulfoxide reductase heme-binding subunit
MATTMEGETMDETWWTLGRATGIVATVLAVAALVGGLFFSARNTGERRRPAWWLDLHNWLGGLTLVFTAVHIGAIYLDSELGIGVLQVVVPGTARDSSWAITWGVVATYVLAITVFTTWPRRRFSRRVWRVVHLTSVGGVILAGLHGFQAGTDATTRAFEVGLAAAIALVVYAVTVRVLGAALRRR